MAQLKTTNVHGDLHVSGVITQSGKGLIEPAPVDGKQYARKDDAWVEVIAGGTGDVEEAPIDGKQYARKDAGWEEVVTGGGDVEEAPIDGKTYGRKNSTWEEVTLPVDALLDFGTGTDKFLLNSDFPDDTKRYSGVSQFNGNIVRYVATPISGQYAGVTRILGRHIEYSLVSGGDIYKYSYKIFKDFNTGSDNFVPILKGDHPYGTDLGELTRTENLTGDFIVGYANFYYLESGISGIKSIVLSIPAGLEGQVLSVSETGAGVGLDFDPMGFSTVPLSPFTSNISLSSILYNKPMYSGVDSSGFEYKLWFNYYPATIYLETQNPNQHELYINL